MFGQWSANWGGYGSHSYAVANSWPLLRNVFCLRRSKPAAIHQNGSNNDDGQRTSTSIREVFTKHDCHNCMMNTYVCNVNLSQVCFGHNLIKMITFNWLILRFVFGQNRHISCEVACVCEYVCFSARRSFVMPWSTAPAAVSAVICPKTTSPTKNRVSCLLFSHCIQRNEHSSA